MKHIGNVVCAIIEKDGYFLIAERPAGDPLEKKWEFPGGKVAAAESPQQAIKREIFEELQVIVGVNSALTPKSHSYEHLSLTLLPFRCAILQGMPQALEHNRIVWVNEQTVQAYQFAEADIPILEEYLTIRSRENGRGVAGNGTSKEHCPESTGP
jgi:8-oxo-dGTP diphosphatase